MSAERRMRLGNLIRRTAPGRSQLGNIAPQSANTQPSKGLPATGFLFALDFDRQYSRTYLTTGI